LLGDFLQGLEAILMMVVPTHCLLLACDLIWMTPFACPFNGHNVMVHKIKAAEARLDLPLAVINPIPHPTTAAATTTSVSQGEL